MCVRMCVPETPPPLQENVAENERIRYRELVEVIGWFFFDLFVLGYVEDAGTGLSFRMPGQLKWRVYIEVILVTLIYCSEATPISPPLCSCRCLLASVRVPGMP